MNIGRTSSLCRRVAAAGAGAAATAAVVIFDRVFDRLSRCESEKLRRDRLNAYIGELAKIVPLVMQSSKKIDKASVLRLTVTYLRIYHGNNSLLLLLQLLQLLPPPFLVIGIRHRERPGHIDAVRDAGWRAIRILEDVFLFRRVLWGDSTEATSTTTTRACTFGVSFK